MCFLYLTLAKKFKLYLLEFDIQVLPSLPRGGLPMLLYGRAVVDLDALPPVSYLSISLT
jgi:hypothetical protein